MPPAAARLFALSGTAAFGLSLVYFLYSYIVPFGVPAPAASRAAPIAWNVALFSAFALHHSVFARLPVREWVSRRAPGAERALYVWTASILFVVVCGSWQPVPGVAWEATGAAVWALRALQAGAVWLILRSAAILDIRELAGLSVRRSEGDGRLEGLPLPGDTEFRTTGPYGWVRHPIYAGWFLLVFAASPMTMTRLVFASVSCGYLLLAIPLEERSIRATAAGAYERYAQRVPWRLVPGIY